MAHCGFLDAHDAHLWTGGDCPGGGAPDHAEVELFDAAGNFEGYEPRECGEHRTVGPHRAWCFDCSAWCYPGGRESSPCPRCELPMLRARA